MRYNKRIIGNGTYSSGEHQQFRDRKGKLVRVTRENPKSPIPVGKAYAFFDCTAPKDAIEELIPKVRSAVQTPSILELQLLKGANSIEEDPQIMEIAREAQDAGLPYTIEATYPNGTNKQTADEVATMLNQIYQSPLYREKEPFRRRVFYKQRRKYLPRD